MISITVDYNFIHKFILIKTDATIYLITNLFIMEQKTE